MGVEKNPPHVALKLSDVFATDKKPPQASAQHQQSSNPNDEESTEKSKNILNKYRVTKLNNGEFNNIYVKNEFFKDRAKTNELRQPNWEVKALPKGGEDSTNGDHPVKDGKEEDPQKKINSSVKLCRRKIHKQSNLLMSNGTIGLVVHNGVMCLSMKGQQCFVITSAKNAFNVLDPHKLRKAYTSEHYPEDIQNLYCANGYVYVIFRKKVYKVNESGGKKIFSLEDDLHSIVNILTVCDYLLTYSKKEIVIWNDAHKEGCDSDGFVSDAGSEVGRGEEVPSEEKASKKGEGETPDVDKTANEGEGETPDVDKTAKGGDTPLAGDATLRGCPNEKRHLFKRILLFDDHSDVEIRSVIHPPGYINKVIILTSENKIYLYNVNKEKIIHEYSALQSIHLSSEKDVKVITLTTKKDQLCVVTSTNELHIINTERDELVYSKNIHMNEDKITCVQFYNYSFNGESMSVILVGTQLGKVIMIDPNSSNYFILRDAHDCVKAILIPPQSGGYLFTVGQRDNKINLLNLHKSTFTLDVMKRRNSCVGRINNVKYLDDEKFKIIVSANEGNKREGNLYILNPHCPEQNKDFSWNKKINLIDRTIIDFDINPNRHYDWNNILVCVRDSPRVYLASSYKKVIDNVFLALPNDIISGASKERMQRRGKGAAKGRGQGVEPRADDDKPNGVREGLFDWIHNLSNQAQQSPRESKEEEYKIFEDYNEHHSDLEEDQKEIGRRRKSATSVLISTCGHIGIVGYSDGEIHSFNMQSATYKNEYKLNKYSFKSKAHLNGDILKLYRYGISNFVSASNSKEDLYLRVWNIYTSELIYSYCIRKEYLNSGHYKRNPNGDEVTIASFYHFNILTVVCLSNNHTVILDIEQKCITRKFDFAYAVTNATFSADNRLILFALKNKTLLLYEIISNTFIDYLRFKSHITSMVYNDVYLFTAHSDAENYLYSFTNKNLFNSNNYVVNDYRSFGAFLMEELSDGESSNGCREPSVGKLIGMDCDVEDECPNGRDTLPGDSSGKPHSETIHDGPLNSAQSIEPYKSSEKQINKNLLTMSGFSMSKIAYIIFLDKIKEKCRVQESVKKNEEIPFFLSAQLDRNVEYAEGRELQFLQNITKGEEAVDKAVDEAVDDVVDEAVDEAVDEVVDEAGDNVADEAVDKVADVADNAPDEERNQVDAPGDGHAKPKAKPRKTKNNKNRHITKVDKIEMPISKLQEMLAQNEDSYINVLKYLMGLSPSGVHFNILCLSSRDELENMMNFFIYHVKTNDNIDLIQAYIFIFLKAHGKKLLKTKDKKLRNTTEVLLQEIQASWSNINFLFESVIFFIKFLTNIQLE
ncbi:U3 small nucleolar RNA-associated protein 21, putative [Plasmodium vivax]|uniref:U3 small nucleolar RNA-associated protein 21, putative n=1 Tax=Plasmodium vivax TaxID=5855 RepID=A0A1G4GZL3_PLAVI|nr:U3 small nucleolar RNA-associated protein 21, putative [Plasmodium vivax]